MALAIFNVTKAQYWEDTGFETGSSLDIFADDEHMLITGQNQEGGGANSVYLWDGTAVDTIPADTFSYQIFAPSLFNDIPYVYVPGNPLGGIYKHQNGEWERLVEGHFSGLSVFGDSLYLLMYELGAQINGEMYHTVAFYDGVSFSGIADTLTDGSVGFADPYNAIWYKNELYVGGNILLPNGMGEIVRWNPVDGWKDVGGGFFGGFSAVSGLTVYKDMLYIYGEFQENLGNPGNHIVAWDGDRYWRLGDGVTGQLNPFVGDAVVFEDELYVSGRFQFVNGMPASGFAKWNGQRWCVLPNGPIPFQLSVFKGDLYGTEVKNSEFSSPEPIQRLGKWIYEGEPVECNEVPPIGVEEVSELEDEILIYPNPNPTTSTTTLTWQGQSHGNYQLQLYDVHGRQVLQGGGAATNGTNTLTIDMSAFAKGIYFGQLVVENEIHHTFKVIKE